MLRRTSDLLKKLNLPYSKAKFMVRIWGAEGLVQEIGMDRANINRLIALVNGNSL